MLVGNLSLKVFDIPFFPLCFTSIIFKGSYILGFGDMYVFTLHFLGRKFSTVNFFRYSIKRIISLSGMYQLAFKHAGGFECSYRGHDEYLVIFLYGSCLCDGFRVLDILPSCYE